ncbi:MAG: hypothetical protein ACOY3J_10545, partial [Bacillota bacterium]
FIAARPKMPTVPMILISEFLQLLGLSSRLIRGNLPQALCKSNSLGFFAIKVHLKCRNSKAILHLFFYNP